MGWSGGEEGEMNRFLRILATAVVAASLVAAFAPPAAAAPTILGAELSGAEGGDPEGSGIAGVAVQPGKARLCFGIFVQGITLPAAAAHIHRVRTGAIAVSLTAPDETGTAFGCVTDQDKTVLRSIRRNPQRFYVNVHNADYPAGAVEGTLSEVSVA